MKNTGTSLYIFTLGREWKLSLAELFAVWWTDAYQTHTEEVAIFQIVGYSDEQLQKKFLTLGGQIRIIKVIWDTTLATFPTDVIADIDSRQLEWKISFALGAYGCEFRLSDIGLRIKKTLQERKYSARLVNTENKNINAASFKKDKLGKTSLEYNIIVVWDDAYLGITLACQDIDAYANRDIAKVRDMVVGMMPPKLVQIMVNIAGTKIENIYDPFCGLGTTLIEAANMGIMNIYGSDLSLDMVRASKESLAEFIKTELVWQERIRTAGGTPAKDFMNLKSDIFQLDARDVAKWITTQKIPKNATIISEGYLGEVMNPRDITLDKVQSERRKLALMYDDFFAGLNKSGYSGTIVMSFPFWSIHETYSYFTEIYDVIEKNGYMSDSLIPGDMWLNTRKWSLLYRRAGQTVGREIVKIVRQK